MSELLRLRSIVEMTVTCLLFLGCTFAMDFWEEGAVEVSAMGGYGLVLLEVCRLGFYFA